jgi:precorrin-6A/cobalt-precorrin-6A reductase
LNIPIIMIDRPHIPARPEVGTAQEVLDWMAHLASDLGV